MPDQNFSEQADALEQVIHHLRSHTTGRLQCGDRVEDVRYVLDSSGAPIGPCPTFYSSELDTVLTIPDQAQAVIEAMVTPVDIDRESEEADRWRIYHGKVSRRGPLVRFYIEAVKFGQEVVDGESLRRANPLAEIEPSVCRRMNTDHRDELRLLCLHFAGMNVDKPTLVGVDPYGLDIRGYLRIVRIDAPRLMKDSATAQATIQEMVESARKHET